MRILPFLILAALYAGARADEAPGLLGADNCRVVNPRPLANESITWSGPCKDGYAEGVGALQWTKDGKPGTRYEGPVVKGAPHGEGIALYANQSRYQGEFRNGAWQGKGILAYDDDNRLIATFENGKPVGEVKRIFGNGNVYQGGWGKDGPQGEGQMTFATGGSYRGHFDGGKPDGEGEITYPNGAVLKGVFHHSYQLGQDPQPTQTAASSAERQKFAVKQDAPTVGTMLKRDEVTNLSVKPNLPYGNLPPEQQRIIMERYPILQAGDVPPYPTYGPQEMYKAFHEGDRQIRATGELRMLVLLDEQGKPTEVKVLKSPDPDLSKFAAQVALVSLFTPATCAGKPCGMGVYVNLTFTKRL